MLKVFVPSTVLLLTFWLYGVNVDVLLELMCLVTAMYSVEYLWSMWTHINCSSLPIYMPAYDPIPDSPPSDKRPRRKEMQIVEYMTKEFSHLSDRMRFNKCIPGGTSRRRPDIFIDMFSYYIIIECDENQHKSYDQDDEKKRLLDLYNDTDYRPLVVLRFNPDSYIVRGPTPLVTKKDTPLLQRCDTLKRTLIRLMDPKNVTHEKVQVHYLYYDLDLTKK